LDQDVAEDGDALSLEQLGAQSVLRFKIDRAHFPVGFDPVQDSCLAFRNKNYWVCIGRDHNSTATEDKAHLSFPILQLGTYALILSPHAPDEYNYHWFEFMVRNNLVVFITINLVALFLIIVMLISGCCILKERKRQANIVKETIKSKTSIVPDHILDPDVDKEEFIARLLKQLNVLEDKKGVLINEKKGVLKKLIKQ
jgi:hypothetical protein